MCLTFVSLNKGNQFQIQMETGQRETGQRGAPFQKSPSQCLKQLFSKNRIKIGLAVRSTFFPRGHTGTHTITHRQYHTHTHTQTENPK